METPILRTKIYIPQPQPGSLIPRPNLLEKLDKVLEHRLTLISASAGSGKTTRVSQWHNERMRDEGGRMKEENLHPSSFILPPFRVAWLSLDEADNDPVRFWSYVIAAVQTVQSSIGENALALLNAPHLQSPPIESILTALLNDIAAFQDE